ncbi:unnamed protein product [Cladocopium goreaui]|uniref:Dynein assembly factor 3 C-terminal domain-containing protein n=1 Tax=Cladocopium goreaui TaxID=2562237 RepID=A0A9P1D3Z7_9DINO|nr:unnamed protein product [Cladocopium goreaui]
MISCRWASNDLNALRLGAVASKAEWNCESGQTRGSGGRYISELETGQRFSLPPEKPEEFTYPYASPLDELRAADKVEEVEDPPKAVIEEEKPRQRRQKKVNWPPLTSAMEGVEIVLLAGDPLEVLKKPKYRGLFHRAFIGAMGCMPVFQEFDLKGGAEQKGDFGAKREESVFASIMAEGGEVIFETLKYQALFLGRLGDGLNLQAHFEGMTRLGFRHRVGDSKMNEGAPSGRMWQE